MKNLILRALLACTSSTPFIARCQQTSFPKTEPSENTLFWTAILALFLIFLFFVNYKRKNFKKLPNKKFRDEDAFPLMKNITNGKNYILLGPIVKVSFSCERFLHITQPIRGLWFVKDGYKKQPFFLSPVLVPNSNEKWMFFLGQNTGESMTLSVHELGEKVKEERMKIIDYKKQPACLIEVNKKFELKKKPEHEIIPMNQTYSVPK